MNFLLGFITGAGVGTLAAFFAVGFAFSDKRGIEVLKKHIERRERGRRQ